MTAPTQHILGIDPKMYRHFAVLTMVISLSVAFFANGEQKRALEDDRTPPAKAAKKAPHQRSEMDVLNGVSADPSPVKASSSQPPPPAPSDEQPMTIEPGDDGQFHPPHFAYRRPALRPDPALLAKMTPAQRQGYLRALALREQQETAGAVGGGGPDAGGSGGSAAQAGPSQQQINRLVEASRARSGG